MSQPKDESSITHTQHLNQEDEPRHALPDESPWGVFSSSASMRMGDEDAFLDYLQGEGLDHGAMDVRELEVFHRKWKAQSV